MIFRISLLFIVLHILDGFNLDKNNISLAYIFPIPETNFDPLISL